METLNPGVYCNGMDIHAGSNVTLNPGIYYVDRGSLNVNGGATLTGTGATIVFTSSTGAGWATANINGGATVNLTPDEPQPARHIRTCSSAVRPADRHANDEVAHQVDDCVVPEVVVRAPEAWAESKAELSPDDAASHGARIDAEGSSTVAGTAAELPTSPRAHEPIRVDGGRSQGQHGCH